jgi:hypothetical protein
MKLIRSIRELKKAAKSGGDFAVMLNGGLRSTKYIHYDDGKRRFYVLNYIDDTEQYLSLGRLAKETVIVEAIQKHALFQD